MAAQPIEPAQKTTVFANPTAAAQNEGQQQQRSPPPAQLAVRETAEVQWSGYPMLVPPLAPRYMLVPDWSRKQLRAFDLLLPAGPGVAVLHGEEMAAGTAALSADGGSVFLGCHHAGGIKVYDTAPLLKVAKTLLDSGEDKAEEQVVPRAQTTNIQGQDMASDAAFSQDAARLFVLWQIAGGITVHDPWQPDLPVLRTLSCNGPPRWFSNYMLACAGGLLAAAAGGGYGSRLPSCAEEARWRHQVHLWRVGADGETRLRTVDNIDLPDAVAISPDGGLIAVGMRNGAIRLLPAVAKADVGEDAEDVYIQPETLGRSYHGSPMAHALCFSHDGSRLVVGRAGLEDFTIYDVASAATIGKFVHPKTEGASVTLFPAGDVLVTGTYTAAQPCVFHRLLPPVPHFELVSSSSNISASDIVWGPDLGPIVALATGSQVSVHTVDGKRVFQHDFGTELFTALGNAKVPVRMQPNGKSVACVLAKSTVVVVSIADGSDLLRVVSKSCSGLCWSPDGALLVVWGVEGARVFSAKAGFAQVQFLHEGKTLHGLAFDSTGTRIVAAVVSGQLSIWEVATWKCTRTFELGGMTFTVCFSSSGDRVAYQTYEGYNVGVLSLDAGSDDEPQVVFPKVNAVCDLKFSPDDKFILCCPSMDRQFDQDRIRVLDLDTGTDADWGDLLRTMALPVADGTLCGRTVGWAQVSRLRSPADVSTRDAPNISRWVLYGAVGNRIVATDIDASLRAIQDNAWTSEQLEFCSIHQQEGLESIMETAPHCSNIRDMETGETVLHRLARAGQVESLQRWAAADVIPVANQHGLSAVQLAVSLDQIEMATALWKQLPSFLTSISASLVMQELQLLSMTHPYLVRSFLIDVEPAVVRTLSTFRTELARAAEVCDLPTFLLHDVGDNASTIPSIWSEKCPADKSKQLVAAKVVVLPDFLSGDAASSPFHDIVARCDASVFDSKLLQLLVQYKWEKNVRAYRMRSLAAYACACAVGAVAMIVSVTNEDVGTVTYSTTDILQGLVVIIELSSLGVEALQLAHEGVFTYFTGPWNILDVVSSTLLLVGSAYHFVGDMGGVRTAGALGVALKCFGLVDYLRSFAATGSLVRMISVILTDMIPFMTVLLFAMLGCTMFFTIHLPSSSGSISDSGHDLLRMLVKVYHITIGLGPGIDTITSDDTLITVGVVTVFTSFVVVVLLNLLIAIMGDSYEKVKESERVEALRERSRIIVEIEKRSPKSHRYHRFMHFVEPADLKSKSQEVVWEGVTRRVTQVIATEIATLGDRQDDLEGKLDKLDTKFEMLDTKVSRLDGELVEMKAELNSKLDMLLDRLQ